MNKDSTNEIENKRNEFRNLTDGIVMGIIGGVAGGFLVQFLSNIIDADYSLVNFFFVGLSCYFIWSMIKIFECRYENYIKEYSLETKEYNKSVNSCFWKKNKELFRFLIQPFIVILIMVGYLVIHFYIRLF